MDTESIMQALLGEPYYIPAHTHLCKNGKLALTPGKAVTLFYTPKSCSTILKLVACFLPIIGLFMAVHFRYREKAWLRSHIHPTLRYVPSSRCPDNNCKMAGIIMSITSTTAILGGCGILLPVFLLIITVAIIVALAYGILKITDCCK
ncbi:hypothetical protein C10C_0030 [Chlamydia serpentis]|uniref:Uncharacterized protein n=1 Tax=Chlamydia serpentis TaxID=1967782 RepID=A0A2R8FA23_9CHLA|nr:hypothetical protein [Chlamydia serpentis]SPN73221.1 hypothetical protein C10C_0030 [Chlamydia serpentis]